MYNDDMEKEIINFLKDSDGKKLSKEIADGICLDTIDVAKKLFKMNERGLVVKTKAGKGSKNFYALPDISLSIAKELAAQYESDLQIDDWPKKQESAWIPSDVNVCVVRKAINIGLSSLSEKLNDDQFSVNDKNLKIDTLSALYDLIIPFVSDEIGFTLLDIVEDLRRA